MSLAIIAFSMGVLATLPLLYKTLSTGWVAGHTHWTLAIVIVSNFFLALHGYTRKDSVVLGFAMWFILFNSVILYYKMKE